jgi:hypothetical protein
MFFFIRLLSIVLLYRALAPPELLKEYVYHIGAFRFIFYHRFIVSSSSFVSHRIHGFDVHGAVGGGDAGEES